MAKALSACNMAWYEFVSENPNADYHTFLKGFAAGIEYWVDNPRRNAPDSEYVQTIEGHTEPQEDCELCNG